MFSATGGADSRPLSPTQLEADAEGAGGVGNGMFNFIVKYMFFFYVEHLDFDVVLYYNL